MLLRDRDSVAAAALPFRGTFAKTWHWSLPPVPHGKSRCGYSAHWELEEKKREKAILANTCNPQLQNPGVLTTAV